MFPQNGSIGQSGDPFANFNPLTTNMQMTMNKQKNFNNFEQAYTKNNAMIEQMDYNNKNNTIHNNIGSDILDEHIIEYRITIDSLDRDLRTYPDPFSFIVKFNPPSSGTLRSEVLENGTLKSVNERFNGPPQPHINKEFRNVKYIKLDTIVLPQHSNIIKNGNDKYELDPNSLLIDDRFVSLVIDNIECNRVFSTSDSGKRVHPDNGNITTPPRPFAIILPDKLLGRIYYSGTPYYGSKIYKNSLLGNIASLNIQLYDSCGFKLKFDNLYTSKELHEAKKLGNPIPISDIRHPLNKNLQVHLSFIIGVVESQINTNTKFER
jgi:hypothetical protein